jgi:hypothetical protein
LAACWYGVVVCDAWRVAVEVAAALALTYGPEHGVRPDMVLPAAAPVLFPVSLRRAARDSGLIQQAPLGAD